MGLSHEIVSQFAKVINETKKQNSESIVYGTVKIDENGNKYVQLDGSDQLTPLTDTEQPSLDSTTITAEEGDHVSVLIKNHTATVIGNTSSPAVNSGDVEKSISNFDIAIGEQIQANRAYFKELITDDAKMNNLTAAIISVADLIAKEAEIEKLIAEKITVTDLIADKIDTDLIIANKAIIEKLQSSKIDVLSLIADSAKIEELIATNATIDSLIAKKLDVTWANIDFAEIDMATIGKLFSASGIIKDLTTESGTVTGELVGVTIKGDLIEAGTLKADRLVVKGSDGKYYALNTNFDGLESVTPVEEDAIHGSVIVANSITAEKIKVTDLVTFGATIGRFHIADDGTIGRIYSSSKSAVDSNIRGIYMDSDGQFAVGDDVNYFKFFKDEDGNYKLDISIVNEKANEMNEKLIEQTTSLQNNISSLTDSVGNLEEKTDNAIESLNEDVSVLKSKAELSVTSEEVEVTIKQELQNGVDKVVTSTGFTFDENGLLVEKNDSEMKTQISEDGMTVYKNEKKMLTADSTGVDAENLHATTYLIIGKNSRFEDYGNRTGCFWIGGNS